MSDNQPTGAKDFKCPFDATIDRDNPNQITICRFKQPVMLPPNIVEQVPQFKNTGIDFCMNTDEFKAKDPANFKKYYQNDKGEYHINFCNILEDVVVRKKPYKVYWAR